MSESNLATSQTLHTVLIVDMGYVGFLNKSLDLNINPYEFGDAATNMVYPLCQPDNLNREGRQRHREYLQRLSQRNFDTPPDHGITNKGAAINSVLVDIITIAGDLDIHVIYFGNAKFIHNRLNAFCRMPNFSASYLSYEDATVNPMSHVLPTSILEKLI